MKVSKPPFSAVSSSQSISTTSRSSSVPSGEHERRALGRDLDDLAVLDVLDAARLAQEGGDGAGEEGLALAAADDQRALLARADERLGLVERHRDEGVVALELVVGGAHGLEQRAGGQVVGDRWAMTSASVSLVKTAPMSLRRSRMDEVVLDDAVDHDVDAVGGVEVRVGVLLVDAPVGGPARVADARRGRAGRGGDAAGSSSPRARRRRRAGARGCRPRGPSRSRRRRSSRCRPSRSRGTPGG